MGWFEHKHLWLPKTELNTIKDPHTRAVIGAIIIEDCSCGLVRSIEFQPGSAPVVRIAETPKEPSK